MIFHFDASLRLEEELESGICRGRILRHGLREMQWWEELDDDERREWEDDPPVMLEHEMDWK